MVYTLWAFAPDQARGGSAHVCWNNAFHKAKDWTAKRADRMAQAGFNGAILSILADGRPRGFKKTVYWPGVGVMEFLRKRVRRLGSSVVGVSV